MFILLAIIYSFIIFIVLFGDYKGKELEEWRNKWKKIFDRDYY